MHIELKNGLVFQAFVGPNSTTAGVPTILAKCIDPVSFPITSEQDASSSVS